MERYQHTLPECGGRIRGHCISNSSQVMKDFINRNGYLPQARHVYTNTLYAYPRPIYYNPPNSAKVWQKSSDQYNPALDVSSGPYTY